MSRRKVYAGGSSGSGANSDRSVVNDVDAGTHTSTTCWGGAADTMTRRTVVAPALPRPTPCVKSRIVGLSETGVRAAQSSPHHPDTMGHRGHAGCKAIRGHETWLTSADEIHYEPTLRMVSVPHKREHTTHHTTTQPHNHTTTQPHNYIHGPRHHPAVTVYFPHWQQSTTHPNQ